MWRVLWYNETKSKTSFEWSTFCLKRSTTAADPGLIYQTGSQQESRWHISQRYFHFRVSWLNCITPSVYVRVMKASLQFFLVWTPEHSISGKSQQLTFASSSVSSQSEAELPTRHQYPAAAPWGWTPGEEARHDAPSRPDASDKGVTRTQATLTGKYSLYLQWNHVILFSAPRALHK